MIREALRLPPELLRHCQVLPSRYSLIHHIPHNQVIAEIGVGLGGFSECLIEYCKPSQFYGIDDFKLHTIDNLWGKPPSAYFGSKTHHAFYMEKFDQPISSGRMTVLTGDSPVQIATLQD